MLPALLAVIASVAAVLGRRPPLQSRHRYASLARRRCQSASPAPPRVTAPPAPPQAASPVRHEPPCRSTPSRRCGPALAFASSRPLLSHRSPLQRREPPHFGPSPSRPQSAWSRLHGLPPFRFGLRLHGGLQAASSTAGATPNRRVESPLRAATADLLDLRAAVPNSAALLIQAAVALHSSKPLLRFIAARDLALPRRLDVPSRDRLRSSHGFSSRPCKSRRKSTRGRAEPPRSSRVASAFASATGHGRASAGSIRLHSCGPRLVRPHAKTAAPAALTRRSRSSFPPVRRKSRPAASPASVASSRRLPR